MRIEWPSPWQKPQKSPPDGAMWVTLPGEYDQVLRQIGQAMQEAGQIRRGAGDIERFREALKAVLDDGLASRWEALQLQAEGERAAMVAAGGGE